MKKSPYLDFQEVLKRAEKHYARLKSERGFRPDQGLSLRSDQVRATIIAICEILNEKYEQ